MLNGWMVMLKEVWAESYVGMVLSLELVVNSIVSPFNTTSHVYPTLQCLVTQNITTFSKYMVLFCFPLKEQVQGT